MPEVWVVARLVTWTDLFGLHVAPVVIAVYPSEDVARQHYEKLQTALQDYQMARKGSRNMTYSLLKQLDPGAIKGTDQSVDYYVRRFKVHLHLDQFLGLD